MAATNAQASGDTVDGSGRMSPLVMACLMCACTKVNARLLRRVVSQRLQDATLAGIPPQAAHADAVRTGQDGTQPLQQPGELWAHLVAAVEGQVAGQQLVHGDAERPDVDARPAGRDGRWVHRAAGHQLHPGQRHHLHTVQ